MWLVVGLGNPGAKYEDTRHNAGFLVVGEVARRWSLSVTKARLGATTARGSVGGTAVLLAQPQTFMNRSGGPVGALQRFHKVPVERVVVIHDDLDLPFGTIRLKRGGGHGGHNGLRDLHTHVGVDFMRVRMGISRPPPEQDSADFVLSAWSESQRDQLSQVVDRGADAVEAIVTDGAVYAMNAFNVRPRRAKGGKLDSTQPTSDDAVQPDGASSDPGAEPSHVIAPSGQGAE